MQKFSCIRNVWSIRCKSICWCFCVFEVLALMLYVVRFSGTPSSLNVSAGIPCTVWNLRPTHNNLCSKHISGETHKLVCECGLTRRPSYRHLVYMGKSWGKQLFGAWIETTHLCLNCKVVDRVTDYSHHMTRWTLKIPHKETTVPTQTCWQKVRLVGNKHGVTKKNSTQQSLFKRDVCAKRHKQKPYFTKTQCVSQTRAEKNCRSC